MFSTDPNPTDDLGVYRAGFYAAGFWGPRAEDPTATAQHLQRFLGALARVDPLFERWYFPMAPSHPERHAVPTSLPELRDLIRTETTSLRWGIKDESQSRLGAVIVVWAGESGNSAGLNIRAGNTSSRLGNAVVLNLPPSLNPVFADVSRSISLIDAIVSGWNPDRAVLRPADFTRNDAAPLKPGEVVRSDRMQHFPDWISYVPNAPLQLGGPFRGVAS
jgi:hypothetical protein